MKSLLLFHVDECNIIYYKNIQVLGTQVLFMVHLELKYFSWYTYKDLFVILMYCFFLVLTIYISNYTILNIEE